MIPPFQKVSCVLRLITRIQVRVPERYLNMLRRLPGSAQLASVLPGTVDFQGAYDIRARFYIPFTPLYKAVKVLIHLMLAAGHQKAVGPLHSVLCSPQPPAGILNGGQARAA